MATADIVARLNLNAKDFTSEFSNVLDFSAAKAKSAGNSISGAFGGQVGESVRNLAAQIPIVGNSISGLSGPLLIGAAGIGAFSLGLAGAARAAEEYAEATRGLEAVLKATGNTTGLSIDQLKQYAEELESAFAIDAGELLKAEQVVSSFTGIAGTNFRRVIKDAADLSAVFGGDLTSSAEKIATVVQNLAQGEVAGLSKGFKLLGVENIAVIEGLAKTGRTAESITAFFDALEKKTGGAAGAKAAGLSGAMFRLKDSISDVSRVFLEQTGLLDDLARGVDNFSTRVARAFGAIDEKVIANTTRRLREAEGDLKAVQSSPSRRGTIYESNAREEVNELRTQLKAETSKLGKSTVNKPKEDALATAAANNAGPTEEQKEAAAKRAKAARDDALASAKREADERARARVELEKYIASQEQSIAAVNMTARQTDAATSALRAMELARKAGLSADATRETLEYSAALSAIESNAKDAKAAIEALAKVPSLDGDALENSPRLKARKAADALAGANDNQLAQERDDDFKASAQSYSDSFYEALDGGISSLQRSFQSKLTRAISNFSGEFAASLSDGIAGSSVNAKNLAGSLETAGLEFVVASALAPLEPLIGEISKGIGAVVKYATPIGLLTSALFKTPKGEVSVGTGNQGQLDVGDFTGTRKLTREVTALGNAFAASLKGIADQLNADLVANVDLGSIGKKGKKFTFDPDGKDGPIKRLKFKTEEEALEAAYRYAVQADALTLSSGSRALLLSSGDFNTQLAKAGQFESVFTQLAQELDPVGAAITSLNREFRGLKAVFDEAGASTDDIAKASELYDIKLKRIQQTATATTETLDEFLKSLKVGSDSPLSLREQSATAAEIYTALSAQIGNKDFDQAKFVEAGRSLLDVQGQISGNTPEFFATFDRVRIDTERSIAAITSAQTSAAGDNPFARRTADATAATADNTSLAVQAAMQGNLKLDQVIALLGSGGGGGFIGANRAFVQAA